jgi:hypothetical protein
VSAVLHSQDKYKLILNSIEMEGPAQRFIKNCYSIDMYYYNTPGT